MVHREHNPKCGRAASGAGFDASVRVQRSGVSAEAFAGTQGRVRRCHSGAGEFWPPAAGFLEGVKRLAHEQGALLIFDEICCGFHFGWGGAEKVGVTPDLACFGKAMGNGLPIACVVDERMS